jgi:hypothetical protein
MATGKASGVVAIDVDGVEGRASLADLERQGLTLPATLTVTTGRTDGGEHRYYLQPAGVDVRNDQSGKIGPHIDVRGTGGFVVFPPSMHASGKQYRSIDPSVPVAVLPGWVVDRLTARRPMTAATAHVAPRAVDWLWEPYIPARMLTMISGDPGAGKSYLALAVGADLTLGRLLHGSACAPSNVLYLTAENPMAEVVRPRFDLLGGDPARLFLLKGTLWAEDGEEQRGAITLADVQILDKAISETHARLVIVDPIQSYLGAGVDLHRSNETRPVLDGLAKLAEKHGCAILLLRHLSKQSGGKAIHRGLGSIDFSGAVRSEMLAGSLPDDPEARALVHIKSNVGPYGRTRGYQIDNQGHFAWTGDSAITAEELLAAPSDLGTC